MARKRRRSLLCAELLETRIVPTTAVRESFDGVLPGQLPLGWAQWGSTPDASFAVSYGQALSPADGLVGTAPTSSAVARAWVTQSLPADVQVSAALQLTSLIPAQVLARGSNLAGTTPTYYALSVSRGLQLQLLRVVNGSPTVLGQVQSAAYVSGPWVRLTLWVNGTSLRGQVFRLDTDQFLTSTGTWQSAAAWAIDVTDTGITGGGDVGLARAAGATGAVAFDDFTAAEASGSDQPPAVQMATPAGGATLSGIVPVQATITNTVGVVKVEFYLDGVLRTTSVVAPYVWNFDTTTAGNGTHTLSAWAYDAAGNVGRASVAVTTNNATVLPRPTLPQHYPWIRLAELAYVGRPLDATAVQLLQNSVDLVVAAPGLLGPLRSLAPNTPDLIYANFSNVYQGLLLDWLTYADAHGLSREAAFYHVAAATPFTGDSPSSQPVDWFWAVQRGAGASWDDSTSQARGTAPGGVAFADAGHSLVLGYPERFREINVALSSPVGGGWHAVLEYPTAVDAAGNPTTWATLTPRTDTTAELTTSGQITFDPPADWVPASVSDSPRLYYVRFRTTGGGTAPVAATILGRDYVGAHGGTSGTIPAFDSAADTDHDGYLNDAEYAHRRPGIDARFAYESRLFVPGYGQMRFATDPSSPGFRAWAVDYALRLLASQPLAGGLFVDNSGDRAPAGAGTVVEPVASFGQDYASLLNAIGQVIAPRWVLANTTGTGTVADPVVTSVRAAYEEFALRPLSANYTQFEDLAALVAHQQALTSPAPMLVLDSLPTGGSPTDPRTQLAALAEYYLLADPSSTFLDFYGGYEPATSWARHWSAAVTFDVGQPEGAWSVASSGADPSAPALTYRVYQRTYANALVLYKPRSYATGGHVGSLDDTSAATIDLGATYYPVQADGTLGAGVTSVSLRNGEGVILANYNPAVANSFALGGLPAPVTAGQATTVTVTAVGGFGHVSTAYTGTIHFGSSDARAGLPADYTFTAADHGSHTFTVTWKTAGTATLTATDTAGVTGTASVAVDPGPVQGFNVQLSSTRATAGEPVTVTVTARDAWGNVVTDYAGTVHFWTADKMASLPAAYTFTPGDAGVHTFGVTFRTAGGQRLTAYDPAAKGLAGSATLVVVPGAVSTLDVTGFPASVTAGTAGTFTVTARDASGNVVTNYTGTVSFASDDGLAVLPANYTFTAHDRGAHGFQAVFKTVGRRKLTATDVGAAAVTGSELGILVVAPPGS
jgi:hypothetical protein